MPPTRSAIAACLLETINSYWKSAGMQIDANHSDVRIGDVNTPASLVICLIVNEKLRGDRSRLSYLRSKSSTAAAPPYLSPGNRLLRARSRTHRGSASPTLPSPAVP